MSDKSYFPTYTGLLTKEHRERIGAALWEFLWCIDKTTAEEEKDGENWGIVLRGKPVKYEQIAEDLGIAVRTVKTHMKTLKEHGYIDLIRAPYGVIIKVRKSKKYLKKRSAVNDTSRSAKNNTSALEVQDSAPPEVQKNVQRSAEICTSNKDQNKTKRKIINTTEKDGIDKIAERFSELKTAQKRQPCYPTARDYESIKRVVAAGVPIPTTIRLLEQCFRDYANDQPNGVIHSFKYCELYILDRYKALLARDQARESINKSGSFTPLRSTVRKDKVPEWVQNQENNSQPAATPEDDAAKREKIKHLLQQLGEWEEETG